MNILVIEDNSTISSIIEKTLLSYGHTPHRIASTRRIRPIIGTVPADLVILSTQLKNEESLELCSHIRTQYPHIFILAVHSNGSWQDRIDILNRGADDCITFPFPTQELITRINALLRRPKHTLPPVINCGSLSINPAKQSVAYGTSPIDLTRKEYHLLEYLVRNKDRTVSRDELLDHVWDYRKLINSNTVDVHVQKIRRKISAVMDQIAGMSVQADTTSAQAKNSSGSTQKPSIPTKRPLPPLKQFPYSSSALHPYNPTEIKTIHGIGYRIEENISDGNQDTARRRSNSNDTMQQEREEQPPEDIT